MTGTSINLKSALRVIDYIKEHLECLEERITDALGPEATTVDTINDFERLAKQKPGSLFGPHMSAELLRGLWKRDIVYHWDYKGNKFSVSPINDGERGFYVVGPDGVYTFVTFVQCVNDSVDFDEAVWSLMEAKVVGFADGCLSAKRKLSEDPRLKEAVEEKVELPPVLSAARKKLSEDPALKEHICNRVEDLKKELRVMEERKGCYGPVGDPDPAGEPQCDGTYYGG